MQRLDKVKEADKLQSAARDAMTSERSAADLVHIETLHSNRQRYAFLAIQTYGLRENGVGLVGR